MSYATQKALNILDKEIPYIDIKPYSHNIVALALKMLTDEIGRDETKKIIKDKYQVLKVLGWGHWFIDE